MGQAFPEKSISIGLMSSQERNRVNARSPIIEGGNKMGKMLTTTEIAKILRMNSRSVTRLMNREKIGIKVGKRLLVDEDEFKVFLENKRI